MVPGFLGPKHAPLVVGNQNSIGGQYNDNALKVRNLDRPGNIELAQADARLELFAGLEDDFAQARPGVSTTSHRTAYEQAQRMMRSEAVKAFNLDEDDAKLRDRYGRNLFGQGCLLGPAARRAGRAVCGGFFERRPRGEHLRLGHAPEQLHRAQGALRSAWIPAGPR